MILKTVWKLVDMNTRTPDNSGKGCGSLSGSMATTGATTVSIQCL